MRIIFFGIFGIGAKALQRLQASDNEIVAVVTKPDAPNQRQIVAEEGETMGLPVFQPQNLKKPALYEELQSFEPDLLIVAGFHRRLPPALLALPKRGAFNTHLSLLPAYRGPVPHKWAIINGETVTGVTVHSMTEAFDEGDIVGQTSLPIADDDTAGSLFTKLADAAPELLQTTVDALAKGCVEPRPQDETLASYHPNLTETDCAIDWHGEAVEIDRLIRGLTPQPGGWFLLDGEHIRVRDAEIMGQASKEKPGTLLSRDYHEIVMSTRSQDMKFPTENK